MTSSFRSIVCAAFSAISRSATSARRRSLASASSTSSPIAAPTTARSGTTAASCSATAGCRSSTCRRASSRWRPRTARLVVTFNGEIYNYIELREELTAHGHRFRTRPTPKSCCTATAQWGTGLPARLRGMFAFAHRRSRPAASCSRRAIGSARSRCSTREDAKRCGVRVRAEGARRAPVARREIDDDALAAYLCLNYVPGDGDDAARASTGLRPGTWRLWARTAERASGIYWPPPDPAGAGPRALEARGARAAGGAARYVHAARAAQRRAGRHLSVGRRSIRRWWRRAPRDPAGCRRPTA